MINETTRELLKMAMSLVNDYYILSTTGDEWDISLKDDISRALASEPPADEVDNTAEAKPALAKFGEVT
ncbi:MAG: hypothetical protein JRI80_00325 [Deltaproteobacteria bacterium]|nr:hypothetical protein [Deltaproteobacteria bacterium]